jgi:sec-independent protein translocase protein TatA
LPDAARSLGKSMRIFKSEIKEMQADGKPDTPPATPITSERVDAADPATAADPHSDKRSA